MIPQRPGGLRRQGRSLSYSHSFALPSLFLACQIVQSEKFHLPLSVPRPVVFSNQRKTGIAIGSEPWGWLSMRRVLDRAAGLAVVPRVTRTFCLGCIARQATIELATSEILPSGAASAPRNSKRRSLRTHRHGGRWPDSPDRTHREYDLWFSWVVYVSGLFLCAILV
jgi:hypothetical protein